MNKLDRIKKKYTEAQASRDALKADVNSLRSKHKEIDAQAQKLAESGDTDGYMAKKAEADKAGDALYVKQMQLKKADNPITEEESREAWNEYEAKASKELEKAWQEYISKRDDLVSEFKLLMDKQEEMLKTRNLCAMYLAGDPEPEKSICNSFNCYLVNPQDVAHDRLFFLRSGLVTKNEDNRFLSLVMRILPM